MIEAAVSQSFDDDSPLLLDATSDQDDQLGGYPGTQPSDFRDLVLELPNGSARSRWLDLDDLRRRANGAAWSSALCNEPRRDLT
jgi:hypothetical protein